ncbi:MAG: efflux RND transporter periplasmic adaptor subunit [Desulfomonilaceae bacterium]|nr:efflux RND transporter periplasmic adaptor subunit [Desulfomonilaceae bacterium]
MTPSGQGHAHQTDKEVEMEPRDLSKLRIQADDRWSADGRRRRHIFLWAGIAASCSAVLAVLLWWGVLSPPIEVRTAKVVTMFPSRALTVLNASGYVVAQRKAAVSSKATGRLEKLFVEEGRAVKKGDILAQLENEDLEATLEEAKALLRVAEASLRNAEAELRDATLNYHRMQSLRETGSVSTQTFDSAEARYKKATAIHRRAQFETERAAASIKVAEVNLEYSLIRAPFDGVILTKNADEGEVVAPFGASLNARAAVATMADMRSLMVEVDVAESSLEKVRVGGPVEIRLDAFPGDRFPGRVHMIVPTADRSKATVLTKLTFDELDEKILPEMSAKAAFLSRALRKDENRQFLSIPEAALRDSPDGNAVFQVKDGKARLVPITMGRRWNDTVEVLSELQEGDVIVLRSDKDLNDGDRIKVPE